ncbi:hypothetical protein EIP91_004410 [Steccherinum ochraceum]|uniref:Alpha/beta hydrolase fold-3 domain-containing protein n=1 Tax=Steccherinum ochraceum TaxID=92696 RepID=A0A4R0RWH5_9APHY|nr:hypothetical protein EIP91_004410 [Steccherinum ochraceum]
MADSPYAHYGVPDPQYEAIFDQMPEFDFPFNPEAGRKLLSEHFLPVFRERQKALLPDASTYKTQDHSISVGNGAAKVVMRTVTPTTSGPFPVYYYIHGGGFIMGSIDTNEYCLTTVAVKLDIAIAMLEYRLAPENPHPTQINDCLDGLKWVINNASNLNFDLAKGFIVGGESAGANLAVTLAHITRDDPFFEGRGRQLTGQIVQAPNILDPRSYPEQYKPELKSFFMEGKAVKMTALTHQFLRDIYAKYLQSAPEDPSASPILYPSHANVAPAYLQIAGLDLLRDEGILYEKLLREAGVRTKLIIYPGVSHGFFFAYPSLDKTKQWETDFEEGLRWLIAGAKA